MISDLILTFFLVFMNGFFVAAEFAIVKVRESQLEIEARSGNLAAVLARKIVGNIDGYLAATQLGITLASLGLGWVGEPVVSKIILKIFPVLGIHISPALAHDIALPLAFALITILHIVFGELAPKSIAIQRSDKTTLMVAYPLRFFYVLFKPFIWLLNGIATFILRLMNIRPVHGNEVHSSEELRYLVEQGKETGTIEEENYTIIQNAFDFQERTARQIMIPRKQLVAIDVKDFNERMLEKVLDAGYSRIPCYEENLDKVTGLVYLKDILMELRKKRKPELKSLLRPVIAIPETMPIGRLLKDFQKKRQQMAVVLDEFGSTKGIVTMEDILEELVGEIQDEFDNESSCLETIGNSIFRAQADASIHDLNKELPFALEEDGNFETLSGYILFHCGRIPETGESFEIGRYEFRVLRKMRNSLQKIQLRLIPEKEESENGTQES
jgi:CBS domain containing-hemolysin-like protein